MTNRETTPTDSKRKVRSWMCYMNEWKENTSGMPLEFIYQLLKKITIVCLVEENCQNDAGDAYCEMLVGQDECNLHPDWMADNCRLACTLCRPLRTSRPTTTSLRPTTPVTSPSTSRQSSTTFSTGVYSNFTIKWIV